MRNYDIAVVGMGPVGAAAATLFGCAGLRTVAFERDREVFALPRAVAMDGEVVRAFQGIGRGEELNALLQPLRPGDRAGFANSKREWLFGAEWSGFGTSGWRDIAMFDQPEVDTWLRRAAIEHPNVTAHVGFEFESFEDRGDAVTLRATDDAGEVVEASARYLVACDGASSGIRRALEIGWHDLGYDQDWLVVDIITREGHTLDNTTLQVCDPERLATYVATKDPYRRWEFKLNPGETAEEMLREEKICALVDSWTPRGTYELRRCAVYRFHAASADHWKAGRVLLAGDAAHQTPPFLGQGMNAGMRDVINLAWKFPLVLSGASRAELLETYEAERQAHAVDLVDWAVAIGKLMEHLAAVEAAQRSGAAPPESPRGMQSAGYGQGRQAPPMRDGALLYEQVEAAGYTGYPFAQPRVRDANGCEFPLDERLGTGFAIVAKTAADLNMNGASRALVARLGITTTTLEDLDIVRGNVDRVFESHNTAVVRPDRYLFGHTTNDLSLDALLSALEDRIYLYEILMILSDRALRNSPGLQRRTHAADGRRSESRPCSVRRFECSRRSGSCSTPIGGGVDPHPFVQEVALHAGFVTCDRFRSVRADVLRHAGPGVEAAALVARGDSGVSHHVVVEGVLQPGLPGELVPIRFGLEQHHGRRKQAVLGEFLVVHGDAAAQNQGQPFGDVHIGLPEESQALRRLGVSGRVSGLRQGRREIIGVNSCYVVLLQVEHAQHVVEGVAVGVGESQFDRLLVMNRFATEVELNGRKRHGAELAVEVAEGEVLQITRGGHQGEGSKVRLEIRFQGDAPGLQDSRSENPSRF